MAGTPSRHVPLRSINAPALRSEHCPLTAAGGKHAGRSPRRGMPEVSGKKGSRKSKIGWLNDKKGI